MQILMTSCILVSLWVPFHFRMRVPWSYRKVPFWSCGLFSLFKPNWRVRKLEVLENTLFSKTKTSFFFFNNFLGFVKNVSTILTEYTVKNVLVDSFRTQHSQTKMENQILTILIFVNVSILKVALSQKIWDSFLESQKMFGKAILNLHIQYLTVTKRQFSIFLNLQV